MAYCPVSNGVGAGDLYPRTTAHILFLFWPEWDVSIGKKVPILPSIILT